jgi:hypothetical protein
MKSYLLAYYLPIFWPFKYRKMFFLQGLDTDGKYVVFFANGIVEFRPRFDNSLFYGIENDLHIEVQGENIHGTGSGKSCNFNNNFDVGYTSDDLTGQNVSFGNNTKYAKNSYNQDKVSLIQEISFLMNDVGVMVIRKGLE